jgi:hypothetical protein
MFKKLPWGYANPLFLPSQLNAQIGLQLDKTVSRRASG